MFFVYDKADMKILNVVIVKTDSISLSVFFLSFIYLFIFDDVLFQSVMHQKLNN